jgi:hypothetical protein
MGTLSQNLNVLGARIKMAGTNFALLHLVHSIPKDMLGKMEAKALVLSTCASTIRLNTD